MCRAAELRDKDSSLKFSTQIFGDIYVCLLPKSKTVLFFYTLFKGTQMTRGGGNALLFVPREMVSEVKKGRREKQKQKVLSQCLSIIKTYSLSARKGVSLVVELVVLCSAM